MKSASFKKKRFEVVTAEISEGDSAAEKHVCFASSLAILSLGNKKKLIVTVKGHKNTFQVLK